jgi:hypothetical protein
MNETIEPIPTLPMHASATSRDARRWIVGAMVLALALRVSLAAMSIGTNDARTWQMFGDLVSRVGVVEAYRAERELNHPPLPVLWALVCAKVPSLWAFTFLMKLPAIAGDVLSTGLVASIWLRRNQHRRAVLAAIAMALSPIALLISGYHCNTDNLYAFLVLLCMHFLNDRRVYFLGGLALAGAINVKLIPVLLIPGAYAMCKSVRDAGRLTAGLSMGVIPFVPLILFAFEAMKRNMFSYAPPVSEWGLAMILHQLFERSGSEGKRAIRSLMEHYIEIGRWLIIVSVGAISAIHWTSRRWNGYEIGFLTFAMLLILAPGFGPQYMIVVVPLLLTISIPLSWAHGLLGGAYIAMAYFSRMISTGIPMETRFIPNTPTPPGAGFGLMAWLTLIAAAVWLLIRKPHVKAAGETPVPQ